MGALPVSHLTESKYFSADDASELPLECIDGEVFPIEAATIAHADLAVQIAVALAPRLSANPCRVISQARVKIAAGRYLRPDLAIVWGEEASRAGLRATLSESPKVAIEIISPSTEGYDGLDAIAHLDSLSVTMPLAELYRASSNSAYGFVSAPSIVRSSEYGAPSRASRSGYFAACVSSISIPSPGLPLPYRYPRRISAHPGIISRALSGNAFSS
ncbi:MAG: Uma2 family endonuclease [Acidobacteria bacterium]|nr:Uma2 family endonuclease [Acidobacteriota bacterium]